MAPKLVYLDQLHWGTLRKDAGLLEEFEALVESGQIAVPLSIVHIVETLRAEDAETRKGLLRAMRRITRGRVLVTSPVLWKLEWERFTEEQPIDWLRSRIVLPPPTAVFWPALPLRGLYGEAAYDALVSSMLGPDTLSSPEELAELEDAIIEAVDDQEQLSTIPNTLQAGADDVMAKRFTAASREFAAQATGSSIDDIPGDDPTFALALPSLALRNAFYRHIGDGMHPNDIMDLDFVCSTPSVLPRDRRGQSHECAHPQTEGRCKGPRDCTPRCQSDPEPQQSPQDTPTLAHTASRTRPTPQSLLTGCGRT